MSLASTRPPAHTSTLARARVAFALAPAIAILPVLGWWLGETFEASLLFTFLTPLILFVVIGALDHGIGVDLRNPDAGEAAVLRTDVWLRALPVIVLPVCAALTLWGGWVAATGDASLAARSGLAVAVGIVNGVLGITAAHELIHRSARWERGVGAALLALVCYGTFKIEHIRGHHVTVSTPKDRSSATMGQSLYAFLPVSIVANVTAAWALEAGQLQRKGHSAFGPFNEVLWLTAASVVIAAAFAIAFGTVGLGFFVVQSLVAIVLLEIVNYIQHYGLRRRQMPDGRYERTTMHHSWNAPYRLSNWFLFNLQRHSDHHAHADRRYAVLRHFDDSPMLPTGYGGMVLLALVPRLWFRVMDPLVQSYYARQSAAEAE
jgi:alkane 1-monooxygenase